MKASFFAEIICIVIFLFSSCGSINQVAESYVPEESGLNLQKISDESKNSVIGATQLTTSSLMNKSTISGNKKYLLWASIRSLSISPDGLSLAYLSVMNKQTNVMIRKATSLGVSTQRTTRDARSCFWGVDGNLYYSNYVGGDCWQIESVNATAGTLMRQLTSNNHDTTPILSEDGDTLYFVRFDDGGPSVWMLDLKHNTLTSCSRGYMPYPVGKGNEEYVCVRNSADNKSEIWLVNYVSGQETLLITDKEKGFSNPCVSKDGQWIVFEGSSKSSVGKRPNIDIFAMKMDGSNLIQLTYHPGIDCSPVWSPDGKSIFFISSRGSRNRAYNIWKMNFDY